MAEKDYSEDLLIQAPTAELLEQQLGWHTVFGDYVSIYDFQRAV